MAICWERAVLLLLFSFFFFFSFCCCFLFVLFCFFFLFFFILFLFFCLCCIVKCTWCHPKYSFHVWCFDVEGCGFRLYPFLIIAFLSTLWSPRLWKRLLVYMRLVHLFVYFVWVFFFFLSFFLPLGVMGWLRLVIVNFSFNFFQSPSKLKILYIRLTSLCNLDALEPHFYTLKLGFAEVYIISSFNTFLM